MTVRQTVFLSVALAAFGFALPAHADAVLTFDRETTGSLFPRRGDDATPANPNAKQTVTVSLKGTHARVEFRPMGAAPETAPTTVLLYDGMAQKVYTLNMAAKTYYAQSYKEAIDGERQTPAGNGGFGGRMTFSGGLDLKAARAKSDYVNKEIGGVSHRQYLVTGTVAMQPGAPPSADVPGGNAGGVNNGAGVPGGGVNPDNGAGQGGFGGRRRNGANGGRPAGGFAPPSLGVTGDVWYADGAALFADGGRDTPMAAVYRLMLPDNAGAFAAPLNKPLVTQLRNRKSLPGESTISLKISARFAGQDGETLAEPAPLTTHLTAKETKTGVVLEDALFALPADFKLGEPPAPAEVRRGQGRGGRRGGGNNVPVEGTINEQ
ncbi:MAG: hypothetical protein H7Y38_03235 [Armatimonadetes bacterium]|nr:hypothetical protein [Armatimonadota bacterium]